jgi:hypothetical protein
MTNSVKFMKTDIIKIKHINLSAGPPSNLKLRYFTDMFFEILHISLALILILCWYEYFVADTDKLSRPHGSRSSSAAVIQLN